MPSSIVFMDISVYFLIDNCSGTFNVETDNFGFKIYQIYLKIIMYKKHKNKNKIPCK